MDESTDGQDRVSSLRRNGSPDASFGVDGFARRTDTDDDAATGVGDDESTTGDRDDESAEGAGNGVEDSDVDEGLLSVVVIARDERERIGECLSSVITACEPIDRFEVVLVDSRSTDGTVDVAREHPVDVLRLPAEPPPTPSAGRFVGTAATTGDLVLFVDGDMVLADGWLDAACRRIRDTPDLGGLDGNLADHPDPTVETDRSIEAIRGVTLVDRAALSAAGGFDPFLRSNEDIDLSFRIRAEGYRLVRLATTVATHPGRNADSERLRRWQHGYYHGRGELMRKYLGRPSLLARLLRRTRLYVAMWAWIGLGIAATLAGRRRGFLRWFLATALGTAGVSVSEGPTWTFDKLANCGPVFAGVALGALGRHPSPENYPLDAVEVVKTSRHSNGADAVRAR